MKCTEFFIGFGPRIWSTRRGETEYGIKAIPAGAYVRIIGMNNLEEIDPRDEDADLPVQALPEPPGGDPRRAVHEHLPRLRASSCWCSSPSAPSTTRKWTVKDVTPGSAAAAAGLQPGDRITSIDGAAGRQLRRDARPCSTARPGSRAHGRRSLHADGTHRDPGHPARLAPQRRRRRRHPRHADHRQHPATTGRRQAPSTPARTRTSPTCWPSPASRSPSTSSGATTSTRTSSNRPAAPAGRRRRRVLRRHANSSRTRVARACPSAVGHAGQALGEHRHRERQGARQPVLAGGPRRSTPAPSPTTWPARPTTPRPVHAGGRRRRQTPRRRPAPTDRPLSIVGRHPHHQRHRQGLVRRPPC